MRKILLVLFLLISFIGSAQEKSLFYEQITLLHELIQQNHYKPKLLSDDLSKGVHELFLDNLDENNKLFTQSDIDSFDTDKDRLDNFIAQKDCSFIDKYTKTLEEKIELVKSFLNDFKKEELDYSGKDSLYFDANQKFSYKKNEEELKSYWKKKIRYEIIDHLIDSDSVYSNIENNFAKLEKKAKPIIIDQQICQLNEKVNQIGGVRQFVEEAFLTAWANYQDPHTTFLSSSDKFILDQSVANQQLSFGIYTYKNKKGEIEVIHIIPGSSAFKNGNVEENDVIKELISGKKVLKTFCVSNEEILGFLNDENHQEITLKLKKQNGTLKEVNLTKSKLKINENAIRGYLLSQDDKTKVGYIKIPSFYTDTESPTGLGVANDVAKEIYKLQKENITGLIIDLRFNGGGSMKEANDLSGMFINRGPVTILKDSKGKSVTIKDFMRGSLYNDPLIIIINEYSASASELLSETLQDYNRAIIVGSTSFGKASAQIVMPLDIHQNIGFCKITVEKFYRVTGKSHQSIGVIPDINLPSIYQGLKTSEKNNRYALANDETSVTLQPIKLEKLPINELKAKSNTRVNNHKTFQKIKKLNKTFIDDIQNKVTSYPITLKHVYDDMQAFYDLIEELTTVTNYTATTIDVKNTVGTDEVLSYNTDEKLVNDKIINDIATDVYIQETYQMMLDLKTLKR